MGQTDGGYYRHEALAVVLQVRDAKLRVLLWQRGRPPQAGHWSLPGGALLPEERLGTSVARHLADKVDVRSLTHLEQLETRSDPQRDTRGRVLATAYLGLVATDTEPRLPEDTAWHPVAALPATAFDHGSIIDSGVSRLRAKLSYTNIGFALAPARFTIPELSRIYSAALDQPVSVTNLQRVLTRRHLVEPLDQTAAPGMRGGRPATFYRYRQHTLQVTDPAAVFRPSKD
ncbi:NUDIX domain-containing protein [Dactylosporangium sp. AC04546]|uniref:NUDIX hydrolase n=1 Tax=Dactylosporangium sp. AC04546 TaxID=2862460 RepID=UPI001EDCCDE6|nr:NUDIX domain-containing protein [Dactylosporangium sp. AC04546]WVK87677.1 NUDIX domain-containing protein [Dactylosporangium sp. AC04546]